METNRQTD